MEHVNPHADETRAAPGAGVPPGVGGILPGGVANAGAVMRQGDDVLRPARPYTAGVHALLRHALERGFSGVPQPRGVLDGVERLSYVPGDVPLPPFPAWWKQDAVLASTARLLRGFHDATRDLVEARPTTGATGTTGTTWSTELADPADPRSAEVMCHNDVCPENVVYRNGEAVALLDFDYVAPGRRVYDLAQLAKMCCPLDTPDRAASLGLGDVDPFSRLRAVADGYGLPPGRQTLVDAIDDAVAMGDAFVERHVRAGHPAFVAMWTASGGRARQDRRRRWLADNRQRMLDALA